VLERALKDLPRASRSESARGPCTARSKGQRAHGWVQTIARNSAFCADSAARKPWSALVRSMRRPTSTGCSARRIAVPAKGRSPFRAAAVFDAPRCLSDLLSARKRCVSTRNITARRALAPSSSHSRPPSTSPRSAFFRASRNEQHSSSACVSPTSDSTCHLRGQRGGPEARQTGGALPLLSLPRRPLRPAFPQP
jgi:hypothetical protein